LPVPQGMDNTSAIQASIYSNRVSTLCQTLINIAATTAASGIVAVPALTTTVLCCPVTMPKPVGLDTCHQSDQATISTCMHKCLHRCHCHLHHHHAFS
jgi:hypothetical protein